jgi:hypothetical protein
MLILSVFFSSKCSLFHNTNLFGACIINILYTGCAKIKKKIIPALKGKVSLKYIFFFKKFVSYVCLFFYVIVTGNQKFII